MIMIISIRATMICDFLSRDDRTKMLNLSCMNYQFHLQPWFKPPPRSTKHQMHLSRDDPGAVGTFLKTFIFTLICTNWLLPTIFKIISSLLVVMGEEKRCFLDKKIELKSSVVIQGHRIFFEKSPSLGIRCTKVPLHIFQFKYIALR